jgi:hypothetical protein
MAVPQKFNIELSSSEAVTLLSIYPKGERQGLEQIFVHSYSWQQYSL